MNEMAVTRGRKVLSMDETFTPTNLDYNGTHRLLQMAHGKAANYTCTYGCGSPGAEWAYLYTSRNEKLSDDDGQPYAGADALECYVPMCRKCHKKWDGDHGRLRNLGLHTKTPEFRQMLSDQMKARIAADPEAHRARARAGAEGSRRNKKQCECGRVFTANGFAMHKKATGHQGWAVITKEERK